METALDYYIVLTTCPNTQMAETIAQSLIAGHHAACVNILPGAQSFYHWEGKIVRDSEVLCLIKTHACCLDNVEQCIRTLHSYEVPEMIALPLSHGHAPYLNWITESIKPC